MVSAGNACNSFLQLCELTTGTSGEAIGNALLAALSQIGFTTSVLQARLLGFCTDGASNLQGSVKGALMLVAKALERNDLVIFHCMNHKLELAVHDAVSTTNRVSHLRCFIDTLHAYYSRSPHHCRQIERASEPLGVELKKIGKIFDVRWLSSSYRSIDAVFQSLPALVAQFQEAAANSTASSKDRSKATGMLRRLQSWAFLVEVALMRDILCILQSFSLYLQSRSSSVVQVKSRLDTALKTLEAMKTVSGPSLADVEKEIARNGSFRSITATRVSSDEDTFHTTRVQFIQSLIDNIVARFPDEILRAGAVLSVSSWPQEENAKALFGDREVIDLAHLLRVDALTALDEFRQYKRNCRVIGSSLSKILPRIELLPVSAAECERGFSCMNANATDNRNQLSVNTLSALIFIKVNGPSPSHFSANSFVEEWLKRGRHASTDMPSRAKSNRDGLKVSPMAELFV